MVRALSMQISLSGRQQDGHIPAFHPGSPFRLGDILYFLQDPLDQRAPKFRMGYLPPAKRNRELNTLAIFNKAPDMLHFEVDVVHGGARAHLHFLDSARRGMALGVVLLLLQRVPVLVKIGDAADGRFRRGRDFDQVEPLGLGNPECFRDGKDSDLRSVSVDDSYLGRANKTIDPNRGFSRWGNSKISANMTPPPA
jgi:hypothetical protein